MQLTRISRGFTLIELLVVIAIIALLIGILLPALGSARRTAWQVVEMNNMRQMSLAASLYADENSDYYNPIQDQVEVSFSTPFGDGTRLEEVSWRVFLWPYIESPEVYDSPAEFQDIYADGYTEEDRQIALDRGGSPPPVPQNQTVGEPMSGELYNRSGFGANLVHYWDYGPGGAFGPEGVGPFGRPEPNYDERLTQSYRVQSASQLILFAPGTDHPVYPEDSFWIYKFDGPVRAPGFDRFLQHQEHDSEAGSMRFDGKGNNAFADGSVKLLDPREIPCNDDVCWWSVAIDAHNFEGFSLEP